MYRQDPLTGERVAAGYQNVASAMEQEREQVDAALLLDSGDAVDNSLLQDGGEAEALALRAIGYDVLVPGLNEFRLGPDARDGFFDALTAEEEETAPVRVLSGNYLDGDSQEPAAEGYAVLTAEVGGRAVRVGVLGLGAIDGAERLPASYCEGVDFAHGDNTENSYVWEWTEYWQEKLEGENCDLVVVVCHADRDVAADFAAQTTGIDLVVGGHGSVYADTVQNAAGENVSLVSGGGTDLTRTTVTLSAAGTPEVGESTLLSLEDYAPDDTLAGQVADELEKVEKQAGERVATLTGDWTGEVEPQYGPTPTATLAAASMLWATGADGALLCPRSLGETDAARPLPGGGEHGRPLPGRLRCPAVRPDAPGGGGAHRRPVEGVAGHLRGVLHGGGGRLHLRRRGRRYPLRPGLYPLSGRPGGGAGGRPYPGR